MIIKNLSKTAFAVALLMGQVTQTHYYEDDSNFDQSPSFLSGGWGWSLNTAHASCSTFQGTDTCITIHPSPPPPVYIPLPHTGSAPSGPGPITSTPTGGTGGQDSQTPPPSKPVFTPKEECVLATLKAKNNCITVAETMFAVDMAGCSVLPLEFGPYIGGIAFGICTIFSTAAVADAKGDCEYEAVRSGMLCDKMTP